MAQTWTIRYTGSRVLFNAVVLPTLKKYDELQVDGEPVDEVRGLGDDVAQGVAAGVATVTITGTAKAALAAVRSLRKRVQIHGRIEIDPPLDEETYTGQFGARFDRRNRKMPDEPPPDIFRVMRLTAGPQYGPHGGPLYGSADGVAVEMKADSPEELCCWWGKGPITEETHELMDVQPCASWEEDRGVA